MTQPVDVLGQRFGRYLVIAKSDKRTKAMKQMVICKCDCGTERDVVVGNLRSGLTTSCGCWKDEKTGERRRKHGLSKTTMYYRYNQMIHRCYILNNPEYKNYGGRGIKVCDRWKDINNFIDDMYSLYIPGLDLDRINNDGDYEPSNCRWVTRKVNCNNRRDSIFIEYNGYKKTISEWADYLNIPYSVITYRLKSWSVDKIFTTPYPSRKYNKT